MRSIAWTRELQTHLVQCEYDVPRSSTTRTHLGSGDHRPLHSILPKRISELPELGVARLGRLDQMLHRLLDRLAVLCPAHELRVERVLPGEVRRVTVSLDLGEEEGEVSDRGVVRRN